MAKRNSMPRARRSRNRKPQPIGESSIAALNQSADHRPPALHQSSPDVLAEIVNDERTRLRKAHAVLGCVVFALLYEDWLDPSSRPSFVDAAAAVRDLLGEALERLGDS